MKRIKGFTLIELMIVIAIIGILAVVLIPKISGMRTEVKLEGVLTNLRVAEGIASKLIQDYDANATDLGTELNTLETTILDRVKTEIKNPFTQATGYATVASITGAGGTSKAFAYDDTDNIATDEASMKSAVGSLSNPNLAGIVVVSAFADGSKIKVLLTPFDSEGKPIPKKERVVTQ